MKYKEGKALLQECWNKAGISSSMDDIIYYKYGNKKGMANYQSDTVVCYVKDTRDIPDTARYVVCCYTHPEIFVAWKKEDGIGTGKYPVPKRVLVNMENKSNCKYEEKLADKKITVCVFREEAGIMEFLRKNIASKKS